MAAIIPNNPFWTLWRGWPIARACPRSIAMGGVKEESGCQWLQRAAQQVEEIEALVVATYPVRRAQLDTLGTEVGHQGEKGGPSKSRRQAESLGARPWS